MLLTQLYIGNYPRRKAETQTKFQVAENALIALLLIQDDTHSFLYVAKITLSKTYFNY